MPISMQSKLLNLMKSDKWKTWRIINSLAISFSFFAPWSVMDWGGQSDISHALVFSGFRILDFYGSLGLTFLTDPDLPSHGGKSLLLYYFSGFAAILTFCVLNLLLVIVKPKLLDKPIWMILVLCSMTLGARSFSHLFALDIGWHGLFKNALWGFWLALIGLVSSVMLEIIYLFSKRRNSITFH